MMRTIPKHGCISCLALLETDLLFGGINVSIRLSFLETLVEQQLIGSVERIKPLHNKGTNKDNRIKGCLHWKGGIWNPSGRVFVPNLLVRSKQAIPKAEEHTEVRVSVLWKNRMMDTM